MSEKTWSWVNGSWLTSNDPWPTWPTQICWPIYPLTRWPIVISAAEFSCGFLIPVDRRATLGGWHEARRAGTSGHSADRDTDCCCCCCCCWGCCVKASHQLVIPVLTAPSQNGLKTKQPCKNCSRKTLPAYMRMYAECPYTCVVEL